MTAALEELSSLLGADRVRTDAETLEAYGRDESLARPCKPEAVASPADTAQIQSVIEWATRWAVPLVPVSSGPPRSRGDTVPSLGGVVLDLQGLKRIVRIDRRNRVALVEAGVTFGELAPALAAEGLRMNLPLAPRANKSVIASMLEREPPLCPRYQWDMSDPLCCTEVVFGNGEVLWTGEAAGPGSLEKQWEHGGAQKFPLGPHQVDYHRLLQGAQGTMGIVTWASLKCEVLPTRRKLFRFSAGDLARLLPFVYRLIRYEIGDEILVLSALELAALLREDPGDTAALAARLPAWTLLVCLSGTTYMPEEKIAYQSLDLMDQAQQLGLEGDRWERDLTDEALLRVLTAPCEGTYWKMRLRGGFQEILFQSTLDRVPALVEEARASLLRTGFPPEEAGVYIQPLVQGTSCHVEMCLFHDPADAARTEAAGRALRSTAADLLKAGAFFSRPYPAWAPLVYEKQATYRETLRKVKDVFDPNGLLNPGKLCF